jgi:hypothetical protein
MFDSELDPAGAEDFRKECETLQAIKHPNLIVFLGAGTTSDGKAYMVNAAAGFVTSSHYIGSR